MKKLLSLSMMALLMLGVMPAIMAVDLGSGVDIDVTIEDFKPKMWLCDSRVVLDDAVEDGRISGNDQEIKERVGHYAFEGEEIRWQVLVFDKNKIEDISDVYIGGDIATTPVKTECKRTGWTPEMIPDVCNARLGEEELTHFDMNTMAFYDCSYTVQKSPNDLGETFITIEAEDHNMNMVAIDEGEYWWLNPTVSVGAPSSISFNSDYNGLRPGTVVYSAPFQIKNLASDGSQVMLDMFVFGDDFEGTGNCPDTNSLSLTNFAYRATHGAYSTDTDMRGSDAEGYLGINYGDNFNEFDFYDTHEVLQEAKVGPYYTANVLAPNDWFTVVMRLSVPEPCNGQFNQGQIQFWGEAI